MSRGGVALTVVLAGLVLAPYPSAPAAGSCASPRLSVEHMTGSRQDPVVLVRGATVTVTGQGFQDGCDDTGGGDAFGCTEEGPEPTPPLTDVELVLLDTASSTDGMLLGSTDADEAAAATWTVTVPTEAPLGRGVLRAATSDDLYVVVRQLPLEPDGP